jgi:hypothetical protein
MKAYMCINSTGPGLVPWGFFDIMEPGIKLALIALPHLESQDIYGEWFYEFIIDELPSHDFNAILHILSDYIASLPASGYSESFDHFWNEEIVDRADADDRYEDACQKLKRELS